MNILELFKVLSEDINIDEFNKKVEGKISPELLDAFASKMKKGKYNNSALAVLKGLQEADEEHREVLEKKALAVYGLFKQMKKDNSSFDASEIMDEFLRSKNPKTFWREKYSQSKEERGEEKEDFGLKNVRVKELKNYYLIFPKTFYNNYYFSKREDFDKGWQELKAISDEMAKKDTSKPEINHVNHWCVASSNPHYFNSYKNNGGLFIVIVKKNKNDSPDWNHRYLWYTGSMSEEFADKKDKHLDIKDLKDPELYNILKKIKGKFRVSRKEKQEVSKEQDRKIKEIEAEAKKNISSPKNKQELLDKFPNAYKIVRNTNNIYNWSYNNNDEIAKNILSSILNNKYPELFNGKILETFKKKGENIPRPNNATMIDFGNGVKLSSLPNCEYYVLPLNKSGSYKLILEVRNINKKDNAFSRVLHLLNSTGPGHFVFNNSDDKGLSAALKNYFESERLPEYKIYDKSALTLKSYFKSLKANPEFDKANSNKYGAEIIKKTLDDEKKKLTTHVLFPFGFNVEIDLDGVYYTLGYPAFSSDKKRKFICDSADPNALEKVKIVYKNYLRGLFPDCKPSF